MRVSDLLMCLDRAKLSKRNRFEELQVQVLTEIDFSAGPRASVEIASAHTGIDWDANSFFLVPTSPLSKYAFVNQQELNDFKRQNRERMSYETFKKTQQEVAALKKRIAELEQEQPK